MKKKLLPLIIMVAVLLMVPAATSAHGRSKHSSKTEVTGMINFNEKHVGKGTVVTVTCDGYSKSDKTNKHGEYSVTFSKKECPPNSTFTVAATVQGIKGTSTGKATKEKCRANVAVINVSVPEYGLVSLLGATGFGAGAFMLIRRRQLNGHQA